MSESDLSKLPFMNPKLNLEQRVEDLLKRLTFEEKCKLSAGEQDSSPPPIERLGIPKFSMTDGPHGVSPYKTGVGPNGVKLPDSAAGNSTYFPTGIQLASTWNPEIMVKFGKALAEETRAVGKCMQLGPALNICRNPMNGRTFEYYSEDPILSGEMAAAAVKGMQSVRIAPCIKHYTANNFETNRMKVNVVVSQRALQEIYLAGFKRVVKKSDPWGLMSSYNKVNGTYVSEHKEILRTFLKDQWGFSGVVVSDFGATNHVTGIKGLVEAGLDLEMGSRRMYQIAEMMQMKEAGQFPEEFFDDNIRRILRAMFRVGLFDPKESLPEGKINTPDHQQLARKLAEEGMVLLKNENNLLPLAIEKVKKVAILGKHADTKFGRRKLGGGSSAVWPPYEVTIREGIAKKLEGKAEIVEDPAAADVAIVCVGLEHSHDFKGGDHEGSDRLRYTLGLVQPRLVKSTLRNNKNTIVVCVNGSPFGMESFVNKVPAILEAWYGGMEVGAVVADILFGDINPSGKLPVSWPRRKKDIPTAFSFLGTIIPMKEVIYKEGIYVGYRLYDKNKTKLRYPFGFGLSYTSFRYSDLKIETPDVKGSNDVKLEFTVTNTGERSGAEIAEVYLKHPKSTIDHPDKELKGFVKVFLTPKESKKISITIANSDLAYFDEGLNGWKIEQGMFDLLVGSSSKDIFLTGRFQYSP